MHAAAGERAEALARAAGEAEPHRRPAAGPRRRGARRWRPPPARPPPGGGCRSGSCPRTAGRSRGRARGRSRISASSETTPGPVVARHGAAQRRRPPRMRHLDRRAAPAASRGRASAPAARPAARSAASRSFRPMISSMVRAPMPARICADFLRQQREVGDDLLGRALELGPQVLALGGDAGRAGVDVALPGHGAAHGHQRRRAEAVALGAEQGRDDDVASGLEPAVGAHLDPMPQAVPDQRRLRLGEAQLPRRAGVLDGARAATRRCRRCGRR